MIDCRFKSIEKWPKKPTPGYKRKSRFRATWSQTLDLLERELTKLRAADITVEAFFHPSDIRNDGWPRSNAKATQPGVILRFVTRKGVVEFACDRFSDWQQNLRAIAMGLEKLRQVEEYGIVSEEEQQQYTGWLKLPPASTTDEILQLAMVLCRYAAVDDKHAGKIAADRTLFDQTWREAVRRTHPDSSGVQGATDFHRVINARERIKTLKGWN